MMSFTSQYSGLSREFINDVCVYSCAQPNDTRNPDIDMKKRAQWDTGASCTVIKKGLAEELGLKPVSVIPVTTPQGTYEARRFYVDVYLPNKVTVRKLLVVEGQAGDCRWDVLVGMDIIGLGDFAVSNYKGVTVFSFRVPSAATLDFTQNNYFVPDKVPKIPGRNEPCPCGSEKKYKQCCGNNP